MIGRTISGCNNPDLPGESGKVVVDEHANLYTWSFASERDIVAKLQERRTFSI